MSRPTPPITEQERRRIQYNVWLASLDSYQIERLCHARCMNERDRSYEEFLNEEYEKGHIEYFNLDEALADLLQNINAEALHH